MGQQYYGRERAYGNFSASVESWALETEARMMGVLKTSILDLVENAQHTVNEGGRMRVDTGFLRWSGVSALNVIPRGPTHGDRKAKNSYLYDGGSLDATLAKMKMGDTFYFGWTAHYARYRELYDGFLEGAMQQWSRIVAFNADSLRRQVQK